MDQPGKRQGTVVQEVCPVCGMAREEWPRGGVVVNGTSYCCRGCAEGKGCNCRRRIQPGRESEGQPGGVERARQNRGGIDGKM